MANDWTISDDGLVYTFNFRDDVPWVKYDSPTGEVEKVLDCEGNDRMVTAQDFEYGILRTLNPETASDYAYVLSFAIAGADEFNTGAVTDTATVGVKAIDPTTLEVTFKEPAAYNANIIGLWVAARAAQVDHRGRRLHRGPRRPLDRDRFLPGLRPVHPEGMDP